MYSYEDRIRAVELYIKLGKRVGATLRQLGYPTKNALKGWYREYERVKLDGKLTVFEPTLHQALTSIASGRVQSEARIPRWAACSDCRHPSASREWVLSARS